MEKDNKGKKGGSESSHQEEEEIDFLGKELAGAKKMGKGKKATGFVLTSVVGDQDNDDRDEVSEELDFTGKKKASKKKGAPLESSSFAALNEYDGSDDQLTKDSSKNKKKSGRTEKEEDDLDKILAEFGEAPPVSNVVSPSPPKDIEKVQALPISIDETLEDEKDEGVVESAAAKKRKKKKEKEKEKKAAAAAGIAESESAEEEGIVEAENDKGGEEVRESAAAKKKKKKKDIEKEKKEAVKEGNKKVPKAVRVIQEALARRKEEDERKRKEEEERLRKEEEERLRQEEIERQDEEARRRKKEREKEKLLKKRLEGKLLTAKQKEEARRLEAMRSQFLATAGGLPQQDSENNTSKPKRPVYKLKKSKQHPVQANGIASLKPIEETELAEHQGGDEANLENVESGTVNNGDVTRIMENLEVTDSEEQEEVKEKTDDEWDAKSWDGVDLNLPNLGALADEEVDSTSAKEVAKDVKKEAKSLRAPFQDAGVNLLMVKPIIDTSQKVTPDARELAEEYGVRIFVADIIYHLFDKYKVYIDTLKEEKKKEAASEAVFPCVLKIIPNCVFNKKDPIILGVEVLEGIVKVGTPICIPQRKFIDIGHIASIENNRIQLDIARKGQQVAVKIVGSNPEEQQKIFGRHFEMEDELVSHITPRSVDILQENYKDDLSTEDSRLLLKLKTFFKIQ